MSQLTPFELEVLFYDSYRLHQLACGTLTLLCFDILLNLKAEVAYVWRRPVSLFKTLYVICRYGPMVMPCLLLAFPLDTPRQSLLGVGVVSTLRDNNAVYIPIGLFACLTTGQVVYVEVVVLIFLITSEAMVYISVVAYNVSNTRSNILSIATFKFCQLTAHLSAGSQISPGIPFLIIAALYLAFAANAYYGHLRQRVTLTKHRFLRESGTLAPVLTVLFRDGIVCYLSNFGCVSLFVQYLISIWLLIVNSAVGLVLYGVYGHSMLFSVASLVIAANSSIISSRLVLVLKGDANYATGIYRAGNELQIVNQDDHDHDEDSQLEFADFQLEGTSSPFFRQEGVLSVPLDVL